AGIPPERARAEIHLLVVQETAGDADLSELLPGQIETFGEFSKWRRIAPRLALGDEFVFPLEPLHLPRPERQRAEDGGQRHQRGPEQRADAEELHQRSGIRMSDIRGYLSSELCSRSSDQRCLYCSAINVALKGRSIKSAPAKMNGTQSAACTQKGGS